MGRPRDSRWLAAIAIALTLSVGGYLAASATARHDQHTAAARRAAGDRVRAEILLQRAKGYLLGLGELLAGERTASQQRFAFLAGTTITSFDLVDAVWVEHSGGTLVARYATTIAPGTNVSGLSALAKPILAQTTVFAAAATSVGALHGTTGFWLLESARFGQGTSNAGYLAVFVPRGWMTLSLDDNPTQAAVELGGRPLEGSLSGSAAGATGFQALGQNWRILVTAPPATSVDAALPWLALGWPWVAGVLAFVVGSATVRRRRAENEFERIFDLSLDLLGIANFDDVFSRVNPAFTRTLGYSVQELTSHRFVDFAHPDDRDRSREAISRLARGEEIVRVENRYIRKDGTVCWLEWSALPVPQEGRFYAAGRDITARRDAEEEVRRTQRVLRASRDELRRLADEHAAVRRVATLVARGVAPEELFITVVREVRILLGADGARLMRCPDVGTPEMVATDGAVELKSCASAPVTVEGTRWGVLEAGWSEQRAVAPATAARLQQFTDLVATALANAYSRAELTASRARVVAAADAERRRIERNLHDGTQQRLVALALALKVAEAQAADAPGELRRQIADVAEGLTAAVADLQELSRGIHPTVLSRGGLEPALRALARRASVPVELDADVPGRLAEPIEVAVYYLVSEALTNAAKHAGATHVDVRARIHTSALEVTVSDDGVGGAAPSRGTGLLGLLDRVQSIGGTLEIVSEPGRGTTLRAILPLSSASGLDDEAPPDEARTPSMPSLP